MTRVSPGLVLGDLAMASCCRWLQSASSSGASTCRRSATGPGRSAAPWWTVQSWHPSDRRGHVPRKITVQSGAKRHPKDAQAAGRSALMAILARLKAGAPGGRPLLAQAWYGGQPVTGRCPG